MTSKGIFVDEFDFSRNLGLLSARHIEVTDTDDASPAASTALAKAFAGLTGTDEPDVLTGTVFGEVISGLAGRDLITASGGADIIFGGASNDTIRAGTGDDRILGGNGRDVILDGSGDDTMTGGEHADLFVLGDGENFITDFQAGVDTLFVPNFDLGLVSVTDLGNGNAMVSFSGSDTIIQNAEAVDVLLALEQQTSGFVQINEDGWGDKENLYAWAQEVFDGYLYVSTLNLDGTQGSPAIEGAADLYRYHGATKTWETISVDGLGNEDNDGIRNLYTFNGALYAGTLNLKTGAELLRSYDGINFETVVSDGYDIFGASSIRGMYEFDDALYIGLHAIIPDEQARLLRTTDGETFTEIALPDNAREDFFYNDSIHALTEFDGYLYAGTRNPEQGFELYRSANGIDFETVIGPGASIPNGIDGHFNDLVYHMIEFQDALYIGTGNIREGFGVYRSFDGVTFEQVGEHGFGNEDNDFAWRFHVFGDELYLGTNFDGNGYGGGSIYRTADGDDWEQLVGPDGLYDLSGFNDTTNWGIRSFETYEGSLFVGTANYPYDEQGIEDAIGAQVFQFLGDPVPDTPEYLY